MSEGCSLERKVCQITLIIILTDAVRCDSHECQQLRPEEAAAKINDKVSELASRATCCSSDVIAEAT